MKPIITPLLLICLAMAVPFSTLGQESSLQHQQSLEYHKKANQKFRDGDLDGALVDYDQAIALDPKDSLLYGNRATLKMVKGDLEGALADCERALKLDPKSALAYYTRSAVKKA